MSKLQRILFLIFFAVFVFSAAVIARYAANSYAQKRSYRHLVELAEQEIDSGHEWLGQRLADISLPDMIIVLVKRNGKAFVPNGDTRLREHDRIVSIHQ